MKTCPRCKELKDDSEYLFVKGKPQGRCRPCRTITNLEQKDKRQARYIENKDFILSRQKEYYEENKEARQEYKKQYYQENKDEILVKRKTYHMSKTRDQLRKQNCKRYGATLEWWKTTFESQNQSCAICLSLVSKNNKDFCIDHDHSTGKLRGILCGHCNTALGKFEDNPDHLTSAIKYLLKHKEQIDEELPTTN